MVVTVFTLGCWPHLGQHTSGCLRRDSLPAYLSNLTATAHTMRSYFPDLLFDCLSPLVAMTEAAC